MPSFSASDDRLVTLLRLLDLSAAFYCVDHSTLPDLLFVLLIKLVVSCVLPQQGRVLSDGPKAAMETVVLQLQVRSCGTAFQLNCDKLTFASNDLNGC